MSEKRPLEAMEEMVHKLPPISKKRKRKETKIQQPSTSSVDQEQALGNLLEDLITVHNRGQKSQSECLPLPRMQSNTV